MPSLHGCTLPCHALPPLPPACRCLRAPLPLPASALHRVRCAPGRLSGRCLRRMAHRKLPASQQLQPPPRELLLLSKTTRCVLLVILALTTLPMLTLRLGLAFPHSGTIHCSAFATIYFLPHASQNFEINSRGPCHFCGIPIGR